MGVKWQLTGLFIAMTCLAILLFWVGESAFTGQGSIRVDAGVVVLALALPTGVVYLHSNKLASKLKSIRESVRRIAQGETELEPAESHDELGECLGELNRLARHVAVLMRNGTEETQKMEAILSGMGEGVIALDQVGRIQLVNAAAEKIFGRLQQEVRQRYLFDLVQEAELSKLVDSVLAGAPAGTLELELPFRILRVHVSPFAANMERPGGVVLVVFDITELRRLEQVRTDFVANVSHELRTPLTSIKGFVETLQEGASEIPEVRERFLNVIQAETLRLQRLIEDLLTLAHIENKDARRSDGGGSGFVQEAYAKIQPVIAEYVGAKGLSLEVDLPAGLPAVPIGDGLLSQVLLNLLENAVKYTATGRVWLKSWHAGGEVFIECGDTGCGIPADSLPRIFERFYRVDKARSREQGGTGLGLSIVKHIVEGGGGSIQVKSELGRGTVFTCQLPRYSRC